MDHSILTIFDELQPRKKAAVRAFIANAPRQKGQLTTYSSAGAIVLDAVLELAEPGLVIHDPVPHGGGTVGHLFVPGMVRPTARMCRRDVLVHLGGTLSAANVQRGEAPGYPAELAAVAVLAVHLALVGDTEADAEATVRGTVAQAATLVLAYWSGIERMTELLSIRPEDWRGGIDRYIRHIRGAVQLDCLPAPTPGSEQLAEQVEPATHAMIALVRELVGVGL